MSCRVRSSSALSCAMVRTRPHPLGEAGECPSGAARHQAGYEVSRFHGAGAPGKRDYEFGHIDPPESFAARRSEYLRPYWRHWAQSFEAVWIFLLRSPGLFTGARIAGMRFPVRDPPFNTFFIAKRQPSLAGFSLPLVTGCYGAAHAAPPLTGSPLCPESLHELLILVAGFFEAVPWKRL